MMKIRNANTTLPSSSQSPETNLTRSSCFITAYLSVSDPIGLSHRWWTVNIFQNKRLIYLWLLFPYAILRHSHSNIAILLHEIHAVPQGSWNSVFISSTFLSFGFHTYRIFFWHEIQKIKRYSKEHVDKNEYSEFRRMKCTLLLNRIYRSISQFKNIQNWGKSKVSIL